MDLHDLTTRNDIGLVLNAMGARLGAEIGVAFGENAEQILSTSDLQALILVDPWQYVPGEDPTGYADAIKDWQGCHDYCANKLRRFGDRARMIRATSEEAAKAIPDGALDFIYIDANHMRPMIDNDLRAWWPKLRAGGIFGGHDYHMVDRPDYKCEVKAAVDEFFAGQERTIHVTVLDQDPSWYVTK